MSTQRIRERAIQARIARQKVANTPSSRQRQAKAATLEKQKVSNTTVKMNHPQLAGRPDRGRKPYVIPQPDPERDFTMYALSTCGYSVSATKLLQTYQKKKLDCNIYSTKYILSQLRIEHKITQQNAKSFLFKNLVPSIGEHKTFPIIFVNEKKEDGTREMKFLGGYNEFCAYLGVRPKVFDY